MEDIIIIIIIIFWLHHEACEIVIPWPGIEPRPLAMKAPSPNHWTARKFPVTEDNKGKMPHHVSSREYNLWIEGILIADTTPSFPSALVIPKGSMS